MSASTVSITANPAARRRPVVAGEKKSNNIEFLQNEAQINGGDNAANNGNDKHMASHSKDLSHHSIRGEAVLERSARDTTQVKKNAVANSTISPRRTRKITAKPEKPMWQTVVSVFTKNFVLLLVLLGLVQMIRRLAMNSGDYYSSLSGTSQIGVSEFESRIAEVESFLKTTAKMIQLQVEVVDAKIGNEVEGLRKEMDKKIQEKTGFLDTELRQLVSRNELLEKSVGELKAVDWMSKEEFKVFYEELKKEKHNEFGESDISLDDIRAYARDIVEREIDKHAADGLGRVDYALASGGALVVKHSEPYGKGTVWFLAGSRGRVHPDAVKMLKPSFGEPGQCFPLKGSSGFVQIKLRTPIVPEAVTLEHVAKSVAYDRSSAPKNCRVSGWLEEHDKDLAIDKEKMYLLSEFSYDLEKSNAQTFEVLGSGIVDTVRLEFTSNHGSSSHTCIYRVRVHGYEPHSVSMKTMDS